MNKYRNKITFSDGIRFDSAKEASRYEQLCLMAKAGQISDLELQPKFKIEINGKNICTYKADFKYREAGAEIIEDVKGVKTPIYNLKKKLVFAVYGIVIKEV